MIASLRRSALVRRIPNLLSARPLLAAAIILPVTVFVTAAALDYRTQREEVRRQVLATATALAEHAQAVAETAELVLARALDHVAGMDWPSIQSSAELHGFLVKLREGLPQIDSVYLIDPSGAYVASSRGIPLADIPNVAGRDFFDAARAGKRDSFVSAPFRGRLDGRSVFTITHPRAGSVDFDGLAGVTVSSAYFRDFYAKAMDYPGLSSATIVRSDGVVILRYPVPPVPLERLPPNSVFMQAMAAQGLDGAFEGRSAIDGRSRVGAYRHLRNQPLFVSYSANAEAYLAPWRRDMVFITAFCALLSAALLFTERLQRRRDKAERRAAEALVQEIDRRRRAELALEQMQKMEALGRLSGGIAHDFNNLLTAILGPLELASKRIDDPRLLRLLAGATQAAQRGAKLTAQMLSISRKRDADAVVLDVTTVIHDLGDLIGRTIGPTIRLSYDLDPETPNVKAEKTQLEMALVNLCVNARDAMPGGGVLALRTRSVDVPPGKPGLQPGPHAEISVTDTGEGMTAEVQARALEPFFTTKDPGKGTGLGLSTVYGFAQSAGGALALHSEPGQGTTVTLVLPRTEGQPEPATQPEPEATNQPYRILLVDDDGAVRMATRAFLDDAGHRVAEAAGGEEALAEIKAGAPFDLMVTDFAMPGMNGAQLATAARELAPDLPVLFVTGFAKGDALDGWERRGARVLDKPFTGAQLARAVHDVMATGQARAA